MFEKHAGKNVPLDGQSQNYYTVTFPPRGHFELQLWREVWLTTEHLDLAARE